MKHIKPFLAIVCVVAVLPTFVASKYHPSTTYISLVFYQPAQIPKSNPLSPTFPSPLISQQQKQVIAILIQPASKHTQPLMDLYLWKSAWRQHSDWVAATEQQSQGYMPKRARASIWPCQARYISQNSRRLVLLRKSANPSPDGLKSRFTTTKPTRNYCRPDNQDLVRATTSRWRQSLLATMASPGDLSSRWKLLPL